MSSMLKWFPFYTADWFCDLRVRNMGPVARAFFLELLRTQWEEGAIPELGPPCPNCSQSMQICESCQHKRLDPIRRLLAMPRDPMKGDDALDYDAILWQVLAAFVPDGPGKLVNKKLQKVREEQERIFNSRRRGADITNKRSAIRSADAQRPLADPTKIFEIHQQVAKLAQKKAMNAAAT